jgi:hypothetical protein
MKKIEALFDSIGSAITSLAAVIFVLLSIITGMVLFSHTLFTNVFPDSMTDWEKLVATWTMALGWEATVLLTTVNTRHVNKNIPGLMAICSGFIVLFFIQAFDDNQTWLVLIQRWFVGLLAAGINYIYSDLFFAKWKERDGFRQMPMKLMELESELIERESKLIQLGSKLIERESKLIELESKLVELEPKLIERESKLIELETFRSKVHSELTCPHCKTIQDNFGTLHAHKGHCSNNPKKKGNHMSNGQQLLDDIDYEG